MVNENEPIEEPEGEDKYEDLVTEEPELPVELEDAGVAQTLEEAEQETQQKTDIQAMVQDALSIGFEGRGIVDRLEIAGVVHEEEMEKIAKDLGLGA